MLRVWPLRISHFQGFPADCPILEVFTDRPVDLVFEALRSFPHIAEFRQLSITLGPLELRPPFARASVESYLPA